jgi:uncharacterized protein with HEPN domain
MRGSIGDSARINHILDAIVEIETYVSGISFEDFRTNSMMIYACIKQLEIIGEATNHLSESITTKYQNVEWKQIVGLRNVLVHEYFGVEVNVVWDVIQYDLPHFKTSILIIKEEI